MRLAIAVVGTALIVGCGTSAHDDDEWNTPLTNEILNRYSPGAEFGKDMLWLARGEQIVEVDTGSPSPSIMKELAMAVDGFSHVRVQGRRGLDRETTGTYKAVRFIFFSHQGTQAPVDARVVNAITSVYGDEPQIGCIRYARGDQNENVHIWENREGGGAVLVSPASADAEGSRGRAARLIVYSRVTRAKQFLDGLSRQPCAEAGLSS